MSADGLVPLRYVAFGDSYTIGTAVDPSACWPVQLVRALDRVAGTTASLRLVANLSVNGYTSGELIRDQLPELARLRPGFASLLVGVNDVVRGIPATIYEANLQIIFETLLARLPANRIITVAIPDYTVTPAGADYGDPRRQHDGIVAANATMARLSAERGIAWIDTFDLSLRAAQDRSLVADDALHPSVAQYRLWVARIAPVVADLLAGRQDGVSDRRA